MWKFTPRMLITTALMVFNFLDGEVIECTLGRLDLWGELDGMGVEVGRH